MSSSDDMTTVPLFTPHDVWTAFTTCCVHTGNVNTGDTGTTDILETFAVVTGNFPTYQFCLEYIKQIPYNEISMPRCLFWWPIAM